jgi:hypothetical protein
MDGSLGENIRTKVVYATWNIGGIAYMEAELDEIL